MMKKESLLLLLVLGLLVIGCAQQAQVEEGVEEVPDEEEGSEGALAGQAVSSTTTPISCVDFDNTTEYRDGKNPFVASYVTYTYDYTVRGVTKRNSINYPDMCHTTPGYVKEYFCNPAGKTYSIRNLKCNSPSNGTCRNGACMVNSICGNDVIEGTEQCDTTNLAGATCPAGTTGTPTCTASCTLDISSCVPTPVCGNGIIEGTEQCDTTNLAGATCPAGTINGTAFCTASCTLNTSECVAPCTEGKYAAADGTCKYYCVGSWVSGGNNRCEGAYNAFGICTDTAPANCCPTSSKPVASSCDGAFVVNTTTSGSCGTRTTVNDCPGMFGTSYYVWGDGLSQTNLSTCVELALDATGLASEPDGVKGGCAPCDSLICKTTNGEEYTGSSCRRPGDYTGRRVSGPGCSVSCSDTDSFDPNFASVNLNLKGTVTATLGDGRTISFTDKCTTSGPTKLIEYSCALWNNRVSITSHIPASTQTCVDGALVG